MIKYVSIYDMDGCIVCSLHRYRTIKNSDGSERIDLKHWRDNQALAYNDSLLPLAAQYRADLQNPECYVIIATARELHQPDYDFIRDKLGQPDHTISRKIGDSQSGTTLKIKGLARFFNLKQFKNATFTMYEDNAAYLRGICDHFKIKGVYVPSKQGH